jgi:hypothetical protein
VLPGEFVKKPAFKASSIPTEASLFKRCHPSLQHLRQRCRKSGTRKAHRRVRHHGHGLQAGLSGQNGGSCCRTTPRHAPRRRPCPPAPVVSAGSATRLGPR